jgi:prepilin-type N-terminal cleavage/methylation domain-containing protein
MTSFASKALLSKLEKAKKKPNGFTLIELMIVVAIVGVLTAVGLPELSKAQNRSKDTAAIATLTNAAKECSLSLINVGDASEYAQSTAPFAPLNPNFANVVGTCREGNDLGLASEGNFDGVKVLLTGAVPGTVQQATTADLTAIAAD